MIAFHDLDVWNTSERAIPGASVFIGMQDSTILLKYFATGL
jgi:hypothetical protein